MNSITVADVETKLTARDLVALTIWGEARSEPLLGQIAVGCVIGNRWKDGRWGTSYRDVVLKPWQFSCWRKEGGAENFEAVMGKALMLTTISGPPMNDPLLAQAQWIADGIMNRLVQDVTKGATHYLTEVLFRTHPPAWAKGQHPAVTIGAHCYFRGIP